MQMIEKVELIALTGDITELRVDAVLNPANSLGVMGGGVAAAIRQKGGKVVEDEAKKTSPIEIGTAHITTAGGLAAKYVIHAPTMAKPAERSDLTNIKKALLAALNTAEEKQLKSLAIPGMGTGVGKVSCEEAAMAIVGVLRRYEFNSIKKIYLVDINEKMVAAFDTSLKETPPEQNSD